MDESDLCFLTAGQLAGLIERRAVSPVEVLAASLARIARLDGQLNCFVSVLGEGAMAAARQAEREIAAGGYRGPLHGIPIALKDIFDLEGSPTTASSRILRDHVATADSTVARKLREAGAIVVGKTNLHEFAFGVTTNNPHFGPTRNPWDLRRVPGGSSGGSGAAMAASLCPVAMGTDTGGSIRIPASVCGVVGLKPTFGRVSKAGVVPLAWSLDHTGPLTRCAEDAAIVLRAIAGYDPDDPSTVDEPVPDYRQAIGRDVRGLRLGVPREHFYALVDREVEAAVRGAIAALVGLGVIVEEVSLPHIDLAASAFNLIIQSEAAAFHGPWLRTRPQDYGADIRPRLEVGSLALATDYINAQRVRAQVRTDFYRALQEVDALVTPTLPAVAALIGEERIDVNGQPHDLRPTYTRCTSPINLTGLPAISVPCGLVRGLPVGMQLIGRAFDEATLVALAHAYEVSAPWQQMRPPL